MTVLLTGADGFLGQAAEYALRSLPATVIPVTRRAGTVAPAIRCDVGDPRALSDLLEATQPDGIVNLAAVADFSAGALATLYPVNTLCPAVLADWCKRHDAHLVQASMAVHGRQAAHFGPATPGSPQTDYGTSKLLAEQAIVASGCRSAIIRFGGIFGGHGPQHLGVNRAIEQARAGRVPTVVGAGRGKRNYVYVKDAAAAIAACVSGSLTGVFYSGGETCSIAAMLQAVCDVWLPGRTPVTVDGADADDQVVEISPELGSARSFRAGLEDSR
jgi:dTDP-4-dehydrorhamnose reductase